MADIERTLLSSDPRDQNYRIVARRGVGDLVEVGEEELSSRIGGHVTERRLFILSLEQAAWLHGALGEVLAAMHAEQRTEREKLRKACQAALKLQMHPENEVTVQLREALAASEAGAKVLRIGKARKK